MAEFKRALDKIAKNCSDYTHREIADISTKSWQMVQDEGGRIDLLYWMRELDIATRDGVCHGKVLPELTAMLIAMQVARERS